MAPRKMFQKGMEVGTLKDRRRKLRTTNGREGLADACLREAIKWCLLGRKGGTQRREARDRTVSWVEGRDADWYPER